MRPSADQLCDPFGERTTLPQTRELQLLGARFRFESNSARLLRLVDHAFAGLPRHRLGAPPPTVRVRLLLTRPSARGAASTGMPPLNTFAGAGFLCGAIDAANFAVIAPAQAGALVVVSADMLRYAHEVRYELIEFAVYVLAARIQGLVPLHAAAVCHRGRGLLLMGDSGAGKSTLALHCLMRGLQILSEDGVFVRPTDLLATGLSNFLHLQPGGLRFVHPGASASRISRSPLIRRRSGAVKHELDLRRSGFRLAPRPVTIQSVIFLSNRTVNDRALLRPLPARQLARRLRSLQPYAAGQVGWRQFGRKLAAVSAFELRRGSHPQRSAAALAQLLDPRAHRAPRAS
ncbi:MAG: serine kinase [Steroidobacteraceae bacterium]